MPPHDHDPRWLPDPIPASYYARSDAPPWAGWGGLPRRWPSRRVLAVAAVALAAVVLAGAALRAAARPAAPRAIALVPASPASTPAVTPPDAATPFAAPPTTTPSATPSPTPTPRTTPSAPSVPLTVPGQVQARRGSRVTLTAQTAPRTTCEIAVGYSPAPQLSAATSSDSGSVSWTWRVAVLVQPGTYPIQVSCGGATAGSSIAVS